MRFSSFKYLTRQGLHNLVANRLMTFAGVGVLTVCLVLVGFATLLSINVDNLVEYLGSQNETVVYLDKDLDEDELARVDEDIRSVEGLSAVSYVSSEEVLEIYKGYMEEYAVLFDDFEEDNPFNANYRVVVEDLERLEELRDELAEIEGVESVSAPTELSDVFLQMQKIVNTGGWILILALAAVSVVVINNTIRITVNARREEIQIMKYVGATNGFVRWPFFVEGISVGLISGLVASGLVIGGYALIVHYSTQMGGFWDNMLQIGLVPLGNVWAYILVSFVAFGCLIGSLGTLTSVHRYLEV